MGYTLKIVTQENKLVLRQVRNTVNIQARAKRGLRGPEGPQGASATNLVTSVNSKQGIVVLNASDVGADASGSASQALVSAKAYTDTEIEGLATVASTGDYSDLVNKPTIPTVPVTSVNGQVGAVTLVKGDIGLGSVDNTSDASKPVSVATQTALDSKVDRVAGTSLVYRNDATGIPNPVQYSSSAVAQSIAFRTTGGVMSVGTPTSSTHATTKAYVDAADLTISPMGVTPEQFGAIGDGTTDDTVAVQSAFDSLTGRGVVLFKNSSVYKISSTITMDLTKVRGIQGNGARLQTSLDIDVLHVIGTLTGSAAPETQNSNQINRNNTPFINDLHVCSTGTGGTEVGTGIVVEASFGLQIKGGYIRNLKNGIKFVGINRNVKLHGIELWVLRNYGIWFASTSALHQINLTGCAIGYAKKLIFSEGLELFNFQIVGNDMQISNYPSDRESIMHFSAGEIEDFRISSNTFEDHILSNVALFRFDVNAYQISFVGNNLSNAKSGVIEFNANAIAIDISHNIVRMLGPDTGVFVKGVVLASRGISGFSITNNVFRATTGGYLCTITSSSNTYFIDRINISGNVYNPESTSSNFTLLTVSNANISLANIDNNIIHASTVDRTILTRRTGGIINLSTDGASSYLRQVSISGNKLRSQFSHENAIKIAGYSDKTLLVVSTNIAREPGVTNYDIGTVGVNSNNL